jgi:phage terminase large subunit-like protein
MDLSTISEADLDYHLSLLDFDEKVQLYEALKEQRYRESGRHFFTHWKENRTEYAKHMDFFKAGTTHRQRCFMAANRIGKSESGAYELVCHLTGLYPEWWEGKRFDKPIKSWACGVNSKSVRDTIQLKLLGDPSDIGTGFIPRETISGKPYKTQGTAETYDTVNVKHISGGISTLQFKSYEQGRKAFEGWEGHVIWLDEECPEDIYTECFMRTVTTKGIIYLTFTPLKGMSDVVTAFIECNDRGEHYDPDKVVISATWDDAPHLDQETREAYFRSIPPHQRAIRTKGIPQVGTGAVYPIDVDDITVTPFEIPAHYKKCYGLDVGWNRTAAIWIAIDPDTNTHYAFSEHYRGEAEPVIHAEAINSRGDWIPGCIDPASRGRTQDDGTQLYELYKARLKGLKIANNAVEAGLYSVWELLYGGKLKIFSTLQHTLKEFTKYSRDEKGKIIKKDDHLMDALRYAIFTKDIAKAKPILTNTSMVPNKRFTGF